MPNTLTMAQILKSYNDAAAILGKPAVKRFADRKSAERRLAAILKLLPKVAPAKAAKAKADRKARAPRFKFTTQRPTVAPRGANTLRARCETLLQQPGGATFEDVEKLVKLFDKERNKESVNVKRRTYELIRIMHYQLGHGLDDSSGRITLKATTRKLPSVS